LAVAAIRPVSFSGLANGEWEPGMVALSLSSISAVIRSAGRWANVAAGKTKREMSHPLNKNLCVHLLSKVCISLSICL